MATSVRSSGRKVPPSPNRQRVGKFYETLACSLLGGEPNQSDPHYGDFIIGPLNLGVDVKASDNNHSARPRISQKRRYEEMRFPLEFFAYLICFYGNRTKNREGYKRVRGRKSERLSMLGRSEKMAEHFEILAREIDDAFLLDIDVINAIEKTFGVFPGSHPGRQDEKELRLLRKNLRKFSNGNFREYMREIGIDPSEWVCGRYQITHAFELDYENVFRPNSKEIYKHQTSFVFYTVFRKNFHRRFKRYFQKLESSRIPSPSP